MNDENVNPKLALRGKFGVAPDRVYAAWTQTEQLSKWFGSIGSLVHRAEIDVRVGGRYHIAFVPPDGQEYEISGTYDQVVPNETLAFSFVQTSVSDRVSHVTLEFQAEGDETLLTLLHDGLPDDATRDDYLHGWAMALQSLGAYLNPGPKTYVFVGRLHPERADAYFTNHSAKMRFADGSSWGVNWQMEYSQITAILNCPPGTSANHAHSFIESYIKAQVDYLFYRIGRAYDVEIIRAIDMKDFVTHQHITFGVQQDDVHNDSANRPLDFHDGALWAYQSVSFRRALSDLRSAVRGDDDTAFYCYRAIETVMQHFREGDDDVRKGWERMRECLRIHRSWIDPIRLAANPVRHGRPGEDIPAGELLVPTCKVLDRFVLFLHGGKVPLTAEDAPVLTKS